MYKYELTNPHNPKRYCDYSHFTDKETEARKLNYLPKVTQLSSGGAAFEPRLPSSERPHSHSPCKGLLVSVTAVL